MMLEHLEAYQIALIIWSSLLGLLGLQGMISIYLEGEVEEVTRRSPGAASWRTVLLMVATTGLNLWFVWLFGQQLFREDASTNLGWLAALMMFTLAALVGLYRRHFVADEVIAQARDDSVPW